MNIITVFGPKGGTGKTTVVMSLASGLIEAGARVAVLDITKEGRHPNPVSGFIPMWKDSMVASGVGADQLATAPARDRASMSEALHRFAVAGFEYVLIDTPTDADRLVVDALESARLILVLFVGAQEAAIGSDWFEDKPYTLAPVVGLATRLNVEPDEEELARAVFTAGPVLNASLPRSLILNMQHERGHLFASGSGHGTDHGNRSPRARVSAWEQFRARAQVMALTSEVERLLNLRGDHGYQVSSPPVEGDAMKHLRALVDASIATARAASR